MPGPIILNCAECRESFTSTNSRRKYCSQRCKDRFTARVWRAKNPQKSVEAVRRYRLTHPHVYLGVSRRYYASNSAAVVTRTTNYKRRNRDKHAAHTMVSNAILLGLMVRPKYCSNCGRACRPDGHHHKGYQCPLDVVWLCRKCHANVD
jgi:Bacillus phage endonuclease